MSKMELKTFRLTVERSVYLGGKYQWVTDGYGSETLKKDSPLIAGSILLLKV